MVENCKAHFEIKQPTLLSMKKLNVSRCCPNTLEFFWVEVYVKDMVHLPMNSKIKKEKTSQH